MFPSAIHLVQFFCSEMKGINKNQNPERRRSIVHCLNRAIRVFDEINWKVLWNVGNFFRFL